MIAEPINKPAKVLTKWTPAEVEIIKQIMDVNELLKHPVMIVNNRGYMSIANKVWRLASEENAKRLKEERKLNPYACDKLAECSARCLEDDTCDQTCEAKNKR